MACFVCYMSQGGVYCGLGARVCRCRPTCLYGEGFGTLLGCRGRGEYWVVSGDLYGVAYVTNARDTFVFYRGWPPVGLGVSFRITGDVDPGEDADPTGYAVPSFSKKVLHLVADSVGVGDVHPPSETKVKEEFVVPVLAIVGPTECGEFVGPGGPPPLLRTASSV